MHPSLVARKAWGAIVLPESRKCPTLWASSSLTERQPACHPPPPRPSPRRSGTHDFPGAQPPSEPLRGDGHENRYTFLHPARVNLTPAASLEQKSDQQGGQPQEGKEAEHVGEGRDDHARCDGRIHPEALQQERDDHREHGRDERVSVEGFYKGVDFYYQLLKTLTSK